MSQINCWFVTEINIETTDSSPEVVFFDAGSSENQLTQSKIKVQGQIFTSNDPGIVEGMTQKFEEIQKYLFINRSCMCSPEIVKNPDYRHNINEPGTIIII